MQLYKEYKNREALKKKQEQDREETGAGTETVIIYEHPAAGKRIINTILFVLMLALIGAVITILVIAK